MMKIYIISIAAALQIAPAMAETITVSTGDTLSSIATSALGNEKRWIELCALNELPNCNRLSVGTTLILPVDASEADMPTGQPEAPHEPTPPAPALDLLADPELWRGYQASLDISGGLLRISGTDAESQAYLTKIAVEAGKTYSVTTSISARENGRVHLRVLEPELKIIGQATSSSGEAQDLSVDFSPTGDIVNIAIIIGNASETVDVTGVTISGRR